MPSRGELLGGRCRPSRGLRMLAEPFLEAGLLPEPLAELVEAFLNLCAHGPMAVSAVAVVVNGRRLVAAYAHGLVRRGPTVVVLERGHAGTSRALKTRVVEPSTWRAPRRGRHRRIRSGLRAYECTCCNPDNRKCVVGPLHRNVRGAASEAWGRTRETTAAGLRTTGCCRHRTVPCVRCLCLFMTAIIRP